MAETEVEAGDRLPWEERFSRIVERMRPDVEVEVAHMASRVMAPSLKSFSAELFRRADAGEVTCFYRVFHPETRMVLREFSFDTMIPDQVEDPATGVLVVIDLRRDVDLIVRGMPAPAEVPSPARSR